MSSAFSLMGPESGGLMNVDSNDGKITRIRPYFYDQEYVQKNCNPPGPWRPGAAPSPRPTGC